MMSPLVRRRRLAAELRQLRVEADLTNEELGKMVKWSRSKVSRIENAASPPNIADVMHVLKALGVEGERWHQLVQIANDGAEKGWWTAFGEHMGARQRINADLEWGAATIREYCGAFVPGLLQTAEYARARSAQTFLRGGVPANYDLDRAIEARLARQRMMRRPGGANYEVILDELVLRRHGAPVDVMRDQMEELIRLQAEDKQISIRILPIDAKVEDYWLPNSTFSLYTYHDPGDPVVVAVEGEADDKIESDEQYVGSYNQLFERLRAASLAPKESSALLQAAVDQL